MNTQVKQIKNQPSTQGSIFSKPKIAFTYQNNEPGTNISNIFYTQIKTLRNNRDEINAKNVSAALTKPSEKENNFVSVPLQRRERSSVALSQCCSEAQQTKTSNKDSSFVPKNSSVGKLTKKSSTPNVLKYPPLSPKNQMKKLSRCPTFLNQKSKMVGEVELSNLSDATNQQNVVDCRCGKPITYVVKKSGQKCCSRCGITKMLQGLELEPVTRQKTNNQMKTQRDKPTEISKSLVSQKSTNQTTKTIEEFARDVKEEKQSLQKYYKEIVQIEIQNINEFYKQKKLQLKSHYQKIKSAIKQSIAEDLKQMETLQQQQVQDWKKIITNLQIDYQKLQQIQNEVKLKDEKLSMNCLRKQIMDDYQQIVIRVRNEILSKGSKICNVADCDTMNISGISVTSSNFSAIHKNFSANGEVYKSDAYRMIRSKSNLTRPSDLTSTINSPEHQPSFCSQGSPKNAQNQNFTLNFSTRPNNPNNKNLLFSFEAEK